MSMLSVVTIGQAPRVDVTPELAEILGDGVRIVEHGALDPLAALAASPKIKPDAALRAAHPGAEFCQQIVLPPEPGRRRHRIAQRIGLPDGHYRYIVTAPARRRASISPASVLSSPPTRQTGNPGRQDDSVRTDLDR